jgi:hypothetical protein
MAINKRIKFIRGNTAANDAFTGYEGEFTVDTTNWTIRLHDGINPGGHVVGGSFDYNDLTNKPTLFSGSYNDLTEKPTGMASELYVDNAINALVSNAPDALNTLDELANALSDDANFASTVTSALGNKADSSDVYSKTEVYTKTEVDDAFTEFSADVGNLITDNIDADALYTPTQYVSGSDYDLGGITVNSAELGITVSESDAFSVLSAMQFNNHLVDTGVSFTTLSGNHEGIIQSLSNNGDGTWNVEIQWTGGTPVVNDANVLDITFDKKEYLQIGFDRTNGIFYLQNTYTVDDVNALTWDFSSAITGTPTTLSGYGITDAQPLSSALTDISNVDLNAGTQLLVANGTGDIVARTPLQARSDLGLHAVASSGDYTDLTNLPTIPTVPTNVSAFTNDVGYLSSTVSAPIKVEGVSEKFSDKQVTGSGVWTFDCTDGNIFTVSGMTANFTSNFINLNLDASFATTITLVLTQGSTAYIPNAMAIDGLTKTIRWQGSTTPTGTADGVDVVTFSILNVEGMYTVLGQLVDF